MSNIVNHLKLKTINSKVIFICIVECIILCSAIYVLISNVFYDVEANYYDETLAGDLNYLEDIINVDENSDWVIDDEGYLCKGSTRVGNGTAEGENSQPFEFVKEKTNASCSAFKYVIEDGKADLIYVAGTPTSNGQSLVGSSMYSEAAASVLAEGSYNGEATIDGNVIYCVMRTVRGTDGHIVGCISCGSSVEKIQSQASETTRKMSWVAIMLIVIANAILVLILTNWTNSIVKIREYVTRIGSGDIPEESLDVRSSSEIKDMVDSVNEMADSLRDKDRIDAELTLATNIQANMCPRNFPAFPNRKDFEIYAIMSPAKEVGGDLYDFFMVDENRLAIVIGDVSGKGVPAALFMAIAKTLIKNHVMFGMEPADVLTTVNKMLCENNVANLFVTAWLGVLELDTGRLVFVNAGHNPPVVCKGGKAEYLTKRGGFVLAGLDNMRYKQSEIQIEPGDWLFSYTDGVTEATNEKGELYGEDRLMVILTAAPFYNVYDTLYETWESIAEFVGDAEQFDDITMLALEFKDYLTCNVKERTFSANIQSLPEAQAFIEGELEAAGFDDMKSLMEISIAFEELFVNIAHYAFPNVPGSAKVSVKCVDGVATIQISDGGIPFDPFEREEVDTTLSAEERKIGGLGIHMVKKMMTSAEYEYRGNRNIVTISKKAN